MPRYIDADALRERVLYRKKPRNHMDDEAGAYDRGFNAGIFAASKEIDSAPTVSPDEVRGVAHCVTEQEAIDADDYSLRDTCSVCGHCDWDCAESTNFKYCPNCGARLEVSGDV